MRLSKKGDIQDWVQSRMASNLLVQAVPTKLETRQMFAPKDGSEQKLSVYDGYMTARRNNTPPIEAVQREVASQRLDRH
jgi:urease accessory protein UreF